MQQMHYSPGLDHGTPLHRYTDSLLSTRALELVRARVTSLERFAVVYFFTKIYTKY